MTSVEWVVLAAGIAAIAWVNWYFFLAARAPATAAVATQGGAQKVVVTVKGGFEPSAVRVRKGQPVKLVFDRQETSGCSEEIVIGDFGVRKFLPPFQKTAIEFTPTTEGTHEFTCGMGMLRGKLIVE